MTGSDNPRIAPARFESWLSRSIPQGKLARQGRHADQVVRRTGDELPVTLPTRYRGVRFHIRDAVGCRNGLLGSALSRSCKEETLCAH